MAASSHVQTRFGFLLDRGLEAADVRSQNDLAERCGIAPSYLTKLRHGKRRPSADVVRRIASTLGQDVADYQLAILVDRGELPSWGKVLSLDLNLGLTTEDERAITQFVEAMLKHRRGSSEH